MSSMSFQSRYPYTKLVESPPAAPTAPPFFWRPASTAPLIAKIWEHPIKVMHIAPPRPDSPTGRINGQLTFDNQQLEVIVYIRDLLPEIKYSDYVTLKSIQKMCEPYHYIIMGDAGEVLHDGGPPEGYDDHYFDEIMEDYYQQLASEFEASMGR